MTGEFEREWIAGSFEESLEQCKQKRLGVSLQDSIGLETPNPNNPINFWPYTPQHEYDKTPSPSESSQGN